MKIRYLLFSFLLITLACKPDPKIPKWDVEALAPIVHSRITIRDMVPDSNLRVSPDGDLSLVYETLLAQLRPDELFDPLNKSFSNAINLQNIDLGSPTVRDHVSLGELSKGGTPAGQFIIFNNGKMAVVPVFPPYYNKKFGVDATNLFTTITLDSGAATLELKNELPVAITNLQFALKNKISGSTILQKNIDTLAAGQLYSEKFSLNNVTIEGSLEGVLLQFESPGSDTNKVMIDTSDKILITVKLSDLVPRSATAIFPKQNLANDTTITTIQTGNADLTAIKVKSGSMYLDAKSTIADKIELDYFIPNANKNGIPLSFNESVPASASGSLGSAYKQIDLQDYTIGLTGKPTDIGVFNSFYTILLGRIDSSGNLITLSLDDSVALETGIQNLTASEGYGYLGKDTMSGSHSAVLDVFNRGISGSINLESISLGLSVENYIGAPIDIVLNDFISKKQGSDVSLTWGGLGQNQLVPAATLGTNNKPMASVMNLDINSTNSNINALLENQPDLFESNYDAFINGSLGTPDYNQFIFTDYGVDISLNVEVPLSLSASDFLLADTTNFDYEKIDADNLLQGGDLKLIAENFFPIELIVDLVLLDKNGNELGVITSADKIAPADVDLNGRAIVPVQSIADYPLNDENIQWLKKSTSLIFNVSLSTANPPQKIKLMDRNFLDLTLSGDLTIRTP